MTLAAVSDSPLELVNGSAQRAVITPEGRDVVMDLLSRVRGRT